ncbi:MAG: molecular chaperone TorD family protein [Nitrososphaerota archaeon]
MDYDASRLVATAAIYNLISASFTSDPKTIQASMNSLKKIFDTLGMAEESGLAEKVITTIESDSDATSDYVRLFEMGVAPPCETTYTCKENPELKTYELADIAGFYRAFNLKQALGTPDHIRAELEFTAVVLVKELLAHESADIEAAMICREARRKFYLEHLAQWVGELARRVRENARKPLYIHLTDLLTRVVLRSEWMA